MYRNNKAFYNVNSIIIIIIIINIIIIIEVNKIIIELYLDFNN